LKEPPEKIQVRSCGGLPTIQHFPFADSPCSFADIVGKAYGRDIYHVFGTKGTISLPSLLLHHYPTQNPIPVSNSISNKAGETDNWLFRMAEDDEYARLAADLVDTPPFTLQLRHFVRVINGQEEPNCSAEEGWKSVRAVEALKQSMEGRVEAGL
jgi:predicted dehydrogenase